MTETSQRTGSFSVVELRPVNSLQPHPEAARLLPPLTERDYRAFRDDVQSRGVLVPLDITETGTVLDGHLRLRAAFELKIEEVWVRVVSPTDELEYAYLAALRRRHLSPSQKAALAVELDSYLRRRDQAALRSRANLKGGALEVATLPPRGRTRDHGAALAGVSPRTVQDAATVQAADPELFEQVKAGRIAANRAASKVRRAQRDASITPAPPLPEGPFSLILADPPWSSPSPDSGAAPEQHYPTMSIAALKALQPPATDDCVLFLWIVDWAFQEAVELLDAWGFRHKSSLVWVKPSIGPGVWVRHRHETLWIATKGNPGPPDPEERCDSVIEAPRGPHSQKPEESYQRIEQMYPHLSKVELFARGTARPGWQCWGNQAKATPAESDESEAA